MKKKDRTILTLWNFGTVEVPENIYLSRKVNKTNRCIIKQFSQDTNNQLCGEVYNAGKSEGKRRPSKQQGKWIQLQWLHHRKI